MKQGPVFVVGMNGSGTTMLADSLGRHPELYMLRLEAKVLPYFLSHADRFGNLETLGARRRLALEIGRAKAFWQVNDKQPLTLPDDRLDKPDFAGVVNAIFEELAAREGKRRWGEKSPMNLAHISELGGAFADASFVHIIRDGREAAQSFHRRYGYEPVHTIERWKRLVTQGRRQGRALGPDRYTEVLYESLTSDPEPEMRRLCEFLGLPFTSRVIESSMRMVDSKVAQGRSQIISNSDKWRGYFPPEQIADLERIAGRSLHEFGYPVANAAGDEDLPRWKTRWWSVRDRILGAVRFFRNWGWRGIPAFVRAVRAAVMQGRAKKV